MPRKPLRILSFLALAQVALLLVSSVGVAVDVHFCQDRVKSIGIFADAPVCDMEDSPSSSCDDHRSPGEAHIDSRCCSNLHFFTQEEVDYSETSYTLDFSPIEVFPITAKIEPTLRRNVEFPIHIPDPPPRDVRLQLLYDVFLI